MTTTLQAPISARNARAARGRAPMRVCFVIDRLSRAGTETQLCGLLERLDRNRVEPSLCLIDGEDNDSRQLEPDDCPVLRLGVRRLRSPSTLAKAWKFARFLRSHRVDVVQTHFPDSMYFAAPVARVAAVRHIVTAARDLGYWRSSRDRLLGKLYHRLLIDATLANCRACGEAAVSDLGTQPDRVRVIGNGLDLECYSISRRAIDRAAPTIGMVANLREIKAPEVFVEASARIAIRYPAARFVLAGEGPLRESLLAQARDLNVASRLQLVGSVADVPSLLAQLDVAVLTSRSEGLSNALLEYMASALPLVCTAVGGNTELVDDEVHGLLVPPGNAEALAASVGRLIDDPAWAARLGNAAREKVGASFPWSVIAEQYARFYEQLVARRLTT